MQHDMKAKDLIKQKIHEADEDPTQGTPPPGMPPEGRNFPRMSREGRPPHARMGGDRDIERIGGRGGPEGPRGQFAPRELSQLKDIMILMLAKLSHSDIDMEIAQALMAGKDIDAGRLSHIVEEVRNLQVPIPDSHGPTMQKVWQLSQQQPQA